MAYQKGQIMVTLLVYEEDGNYVAKCTEPGAASCGSTIDKAYPNIKEALNLHLNTLEEVEERDRFLNERGTSTMPKQERTTTGRQVSEVSVPQRIFRFKARGGPVSGFRLA